MVVLAGCTIDVKFKFPTVRLLEVTTDWRLPDGTSVVCNNQPTVIRYKFDVSYAGDSSLSTLLDRWRVTYTGQNLQDNRYDQDLTLASPRDTSDRTIEVDGRTVTVTTRYNDTRFFPQSEDASFEPTAIIIVPKPAPPAPTDAGSATLEITAWNPEGSSLARANYTRRIPVFGNCAL